MGSPPGAAPQARPATLTPAIIILGADALLAARPALPTQLANACYAAGYSAVIPSSWGDELVAAGCLREIAARGQGSVVLCACPRVAERMRRIESLLPQLLPLAPPPVAAARYLRARAGRHGVHITYVGDCPGGADPAIDRHATSGALLRSLAKRGIDPANQPTEVEERLLRDARRFYSLPGGAPAPNWLYVEKRGYTLIEPSARDFLAEVAFRVSKRERRVVDLAPRLGCACSGAVVGQPWTAARDTIAAMEPPRAVHEVLDHDVPVDLATPLDPWTGSAAAGDRTMSISLEALAAMYDADSKASTIRTLAPPPIPRRGRASEERAEEPVTPTRTEAPIQNATSAVATSEPPSPHDADPARERSAGERNSSEVWPGPEPRLGEDGRAIVASDESPEIVPWDAGPSRLRQWIVIGACLLLAVVATAVVGMLLLGSGSARRPGAGPSTASTSGPTPAATPDTTQSAAPSTADSAAPAVDSAASSADTIEPIVRPTPDLPRLPIRPTSIGRRAPDASLLARSADATPLPRGFRSNPAPMYSPGAAPVPRAVEPNGSTAAPPRPPIRSAPAAESARSTSATPASTSTPAELTAIRAEISRRSHRVDSLRQVLDSLAPQR